MNAYREHDTPTPTPQRAGTTTCPATLLAAIQSGDTDARLALWEAMRDWQRKGVAQATAADRLNHVRHSWNMTGRASWAETIDAALADLKAAREAFTARDEWLLAVLCAWERCSGFPFPGVVDPDSSQGASLTLERDAERELSIVRRVPPWGTEEKKERATMPAIQIRHYWTGESAAPGDGPLPDERVRA